jgi:hypothetical protein
MASYQQYAQLGKKANTSAATGNSSCKQSSCSCHPLFFLLYGTPLVRADMQGAAPKRYGDTLFAELICLLACLMTDDGQLEYSTLDPCLHPRELKKCKIVHNT